MADMIKFFKGLEANLPAAGTNGAIYITTDEGGIYLGTGTGMKRLGDFIQVANVAALPAKAHENCLYYCVAENILAKWNGTEWKQINKQPTAEELKTLLGLGAMAYKSEVAEADLNADLKAKVNASAAANHTHANKDLLDTYTQTEADLADAVAKKHEHANKTELDKIAAGDKAKWDAVVADHLVAADKTALEDAIGDVNTALGEEVTRAKAAEKANADAITGIKNGAVVNNFAGVEAELAKKVDKVDGKSLIDDAEITRLAGMSDGANKVEASATNGNIKIDGVETVVYTHPAKHAIADVDGLQDALNGMQAKGDYAAEEHTHIASEITDLDATIKAYDYATKAEAQGYVDAYKTANDKALADEAQARKDADAGLQEAIDAINNTETGILKQAKDYTDGKDAAIQAAQKAGDDAMAEAKAKVASVAAGDASVTVAGTSTAPTVAVKLDPAADNAIKLGENGLKVEIGAAPEYSIVKAAESGEYAAVYNLTKDGTIVGASINIPKDIVVKSGSVVGDEIVLVLNDEAATEIKIPVASLIEYVTSGSVAGDMVVVNVSDDHKVTATITDGTITLAKLTTEVQTAIGKAHTHENAAVLNGITADDVENWNGAQAAAEATAATALEAARTEITAEIATAKGEAIADAEGKLATAIESAKTDAANQDAVVLAEAQAYADQAEADAVAAAEGKVNALADNVYTKEQTYTQEEVNALLSAAQSWGEF